MTGETSPVAPAEDGRTEELAARGLAVLRNVTDVEILEEQLIEARFSGQEAAEAYLYVIMPTPENRLPKPVVGPTLDFKRLIVALMNRTGETALAISEEPPIIQDVALPSGPMLVRVLTRAVDKKTGVVKWAVKEEPRRSMHAATIALEKAEGKALESHPSYNRKLVNQKIKQFLRKLGVDPQTVTIAGGGGASAWGALFGRARAAGVEPEAVREAVREAVGKGLSEVGTPAEVAAAVGAVDAVIDRTGHQAPTGRMRRTPPSTQPSDAQPPSEAVSVMDRIKALTGQLQMTGEQKARLWTLAGGPKATEDDFRRVLLALEQMADGVPMEQAVQDARRVVP